MTSFKNWMAQIRANFLILSVLLVLLGAALSLKYPLNQDSFHVLHFLMVLIGVIAAHISVNLFNEYSDYFTKIDFHTQRTPFSGGSGMLVKGKNNPRAVFRVAVITLIIALMAGFYFSFYSHWSILILAFLGTFSIVFYTNLLAKYMMGELFAGLALGTLVVLGTYIALNFTPEMMLFEVFPGEVVWLSIPPGILTALLLLINQFPDIEADKKGGRKHLVIRLGVKRAAWIYVGGMFTTFVIILLLPLFSISSFWVYLGLLPLPLAFKASHTAVKHGNAIPEIIPALGNNVITVLGVDLMLAVAVFIDVI